MAPACARSLGLPPPSLPTSGRAVPLILASASPRRARLLRLTGIPFEVFACPAEPEPCPRADPRRAVVQGACHKALWVARRRPGRLVLGADTLVVADGQALGKPGNADQAHAMLTTLAGRTHQVYTGFALVTCQQQRCRVLWREWVGTQVKFRPLSPAQIAAYVATAQPFDKAGAYGIQGAARSFVESIRGSYYNVVGLPVTRVLRALDALGQTRYQRRQPGRLRASYRANPSRPCPRTAGTSTREVTRRSA